MYAREWRYMAEGSTIDLHVTSLPSRVEAITLLQALDLETRDTNVYKMSL